MTGLHHIFIAELSRAEDYSWQVDSIRIEHPEGVPDVEVLTACDVEDCPFAVVEAALGRILDPGPGLRTGLPIEWDHWADQEEGERLAAHGVIHVRDNGEWRVPDGACACCYSGITQRIYGALRWYILLRVNESWGLGDFTSMRVKAAFDPEWDEDIDAWRAITDDDRWTWEGLS
jgi:hypothetical protein